MRFDKVHGRWVAAGAVVLLSLALGGHPALRGEEGEASPQSADGAEGEEVALPLPAEAAVTAPALVSQESSGEGGPYLVGPRDILSISVYGEQELTGTFPVSPRGTINLGWLGEVPVSGLTAVAVDEKLTDILGEKYIRDPQVQVRVTGFHSRKAYLFGRVARPGVYELKEESTLLDLLLMAEGPSKLAGDKVTILRFPEGKEGEPEKITVRLFQLLVQGDASQNVHIKDGDIVTVAEMGRDEDEGLPVSEDEDRVYIVGAVERPGAFPWREDLSALDLILSANGLKEFASGNRAKIIRKKGAEHEEIPIRLKDVMRGDRTKNVLLQPGDMVVVPESFF